MCHPLADFGAAVDAGGLIFGELLEQGANGDDECVVCQGGCVYGGVTGTQVVAHSVDVWVKVGEEVVGVGDWFHGCGVVGWAIN